MQEMAMAAQKLRDEDAFDFQVSQNRMDRISRMFETALGSDYFLERFNDNAQNSDNDELWEALYNLFADEDEGEGGP